ncbi:HipA domain-containing protein [Pseudonocardia sp. CA-107938]|uniref:HipA domain-containing protein n=1 Tax=Pseudonocardia sp. CA-107938 TaxID=3240021 RepID=UPI003D8CE694
MAPGAFPVLDVSDWELIENEVLGQNPKVWLRAPGGTTDRQDDWLFKPVVTPPSTGITQGEDWSEKIVSELAVLLGVPCAEVQLAQRQGERGLISRNVVPAGWIRILGSDLLRAREPSYVGAYLDGRGVEVRPKGRPGHSPQKIARVLEGCGPPSGSDELGSAVAVFAGFLVLDAWVANQDRHDQNWAVLRSADMSMQMRLAPSYDHASSLGFNLRDQQRIDWSNRGLSGFVRRARAGRFEHDPSVPTSRRPTLVDVAREMLELAGRQVETVWMDRLRRIERSDVESVVARIPELSVVTATFVAEILDLNRGRLLDEC